MSATLFGTTRLVPSSHGGPMYADLGLVLHVTTNHFSPYGFFSNPDNEASSHWWISDGGAVEQYVTAGIVAWAQAAGNGAYHSVETSGTADEPLTAAQVEALAQLYAWGHLQRGWPLQTTDVPGTPGLGWHGMGAPSWGHAACPGVRKDQRQTVIDRARQIAYPIQEDSMSAAEVADLKATINTYQQTLLAKVDALGAAVAHVDQQSSSIGQPLYCSATADSPGAAGSDNGRDTRIWVILDGKRARVHAGLENRVAPVVLPWALIASYPEVTA